MHSTPRAYAALRIVENGVNNVDLEPVNKVERCVVNGPIEDLMDLE